MNDKLKWDWLVPPGKSGDATVSHFEIGQHECAMQIMSYAHHPVPLGTYCRLHVGRMFMMSNTPWERWTCRKILQGAQGDVLILGLGLGCIVRELLSDRHDRVSSITVVEINAGVIQLCGPHIEHTKVELIEGNAFKFVPERRFDCVWIDIWPDATETWTKERRSLAARYRRFVKPGGWVATWRMAWGNQ